MEKVLLDFLPPTENNIAALHIWEGTAPDAVFTEIERTTAVGTYPSYITRYTTAKAASKTDWFAIQWEDSNGLLSEISSPIQGGTTTLVQTLVDRVALRDPSLNENVVAQEAEAAISSFFGVLDPYGIDPTSVSPATLSGLTLLVLARTYLFTSVSATTSNVQKFTAGLVSIDAGSSSSSSGGGLKNLQEIMDLANRMLGRNYSIIGVLAELPVADGVKQIVAADLSRTIIEVA